LNGLNSQISSLNQSNSNLRAQIENLKNEIALKRQKIQTLDGEISVLQQEVAALQAEIQQHLDTISQQTQRIAELERNIMWLQGSIVALQNQQGKADEMIETLETEKLDLETKLAQKQTEYNEAKELAEKLTAENIAAEQEYTSILQSLIYTLEELMKRYDAVVNAIYQVRQAYKDLLTTCPNLVPNSVVADKSSGTLYYVEKQNNTIVLRTFPDADVFRSYGSPTYTLYESSYLSGCEKGSPMEMKPEVVVTPPPVTPPPEWLQAPFIVSFVSAYHWMRQGIIKVLQVVGNTPTLTSFGLMNTQFTLQPDGSIQTLNGAEFSLTANTDVKEKGWSFVPYPQLGKVAFQIQMYGQTVGSSPDNLVIPVPASSQSLRTVFFIIPIGKKM
jgi:predicted  nucleic acid-binding Zn-ribbon protein